MSSPRWIRLATLALLALPAGSQGCPDCCAGEIHDDGSVELFFAPFYGGPNGRMHYVSRFTPASYPFAYTEACLFVRHVPDVPLTFDVIVYDDDGGGGAPGTLLAEVPHTIGAVTGWVTVPLDCQAAVASGSVWIGMRWQLALANDIVIGVDSSASHPLSWSLDGTTWDATSPQEPSTLMIRARGNPGSGTSAGASFRNGSGVNPLCYVSSAPQINGTWTARVNHAFYPTASFTQVHFRQRPATGPTISAGELLLDFTSARLFVSSVPSTSLSDLHQQPIPNDPSLIGVSIATQGVVFGPSGPVLCNAYDLVVGC